MEARFSVIIIALQFKGYPRKLCSGGQEEHANEYDTVECGAWYGRIQKLRISFGDIMELRHFEMEGRL